jgi:hypothetical protein
MATRVVVEVLAGVIPEQPEQAYTRTWSIDSETWEQAQDQGGILAELNGRAQGYAMLLMLQPDRFNWVRVDWLWL